jgi:trimethylamine:corrinoid methyltransferase-like protein
MLIDRMRYDRWVQQGSKDMATRANERAREILAEHEVAPLSDAAEEAIADVLQRRETV